MKNEPIYGMAKPWEDNYLSRRTYPDTYYVPDGVFEYKTYEAKCDIPKHTWVLENMVKELNGNNPT